MLKLLAPGECGPLVGALSLTLHAVLAATHREQRGTREEERGLSEKTGG